MPAYFDKLNYSLANEDARIEHDLLKAKTDTVFTVAGSGARAVPLLARNPTHLIVNDLVDSQLWLTELRMAAAKQLPYDEFLYFMGYRGAITDGHLAGDDRLPLFESLDLSPEAREFWAKHQKEWLPRGFIWLGKWESHFRSIHKILQGVLRMNIRAIFEAHSLEEQIELYEKHWKPQLFRNFVRFAASEFVFNRFLYKGHFAGSKDRKTDPRAPWQVFDEEFRRLFQTTMVRKSYFLQMIFLGGIHFEEGLPFEAWASTHAHIRKSKTEVKFVKGDLLDVLKKQPADFYSLSDVISYLKPEDAAKMLQNLPKATPAKAKVVIRSFLKAPTAIETEGWTEEEKLNERCRLEDCTGVYQFHIFTKK